MESAPGKLTGLLREIAERLKRAAGADIVSLHLFEEEHDRYYAPVIVGVPETGLAESLDDMRDQLARYRADAAQGKAPSELNVTQYGSNVWLTVSRRTLVAADAQAEVDSSFIRRHQVVSVVGLPLLAGRSLLGLLYLDFSMLLYASLHLSTYLFVDQGFDFPGIGKDIAKRRFVTVGFAAWCALVPLAVTSTQAWVKRLGFRRWKSLHRLAYLAGALACVHFIWRFKTALLQPIYSCSPACARVRSDRLQSPTSCSPRWTNAMMRSVETAAFLRIAGARCWSFQRRRRHYKRRR